MPQNNCDTVKHIKFEILGDPKPKGRPRFAVRGSGKRSFAMAYTDKKTREAEQSFLTQALPHRPPAPIPHAINLLMWCGMPIPKSTSKKAKALMESGQVCHTKRPDFDNLIKIIDALTGVFWIDDSQIYKIRFLKAYSQIPRTVIRIQWIEPNQ